LTFVIIFGLVMSVTFAAIIAEVMMRKYWQRKGDARDFEKHVRKLMKPGSTLEDYETWEQNRRMNLK
jgi:hypothetical protein